MNTKTAIVLTTLVAVVVVMAASTIKVQPVYAPGGMCMGCISAPGQQEGAASNSAPGHVFSGGGHFGAAPFAPPRTMS